jgi:hypothetical protein
MEDVAMTKGGRVLMTYSLAMAAGQDAANRQMRKAGRKKWSRDDYNEAVRKFNALYPLDEHLAQMRAGLVG